MREYVKENEFDAKMADAVISYLEKRAAKRMCEARGGGTLYAVHYTADNPRGTLVLVHGFSENADKYRECIYYLLREHYSVLIFDQRGHGRSHREAPVNVVHVDRFEQYAEDLEDVLAAYRSSLTAPLFLFAHSMGGAVSMLFLQKHPNVFKKAVLSAPLVSLQYRGLVRVCAASACRFCTLTGRAKKTVFIAKRDYENEPFERSSALSPARFAYLKSLRMSDPLLCGGAPSYAWSLAAIGITKKLLDKRALARVKLPVLILSAEIEHLVCPNAQQKLARILPNGHFKRIAHSKHEILFASDDILHPVLDEILDFLQ